MTDAQVTVNNFVELLLAAAPETAPVVDDHLAEYDGELLIHLLMGNLWRLAGDAIGSGNFMASAKLLSFLGSAFENADERVVNAIAVSFVEHVGGGQVRHPSSSPAGPVRF